MLFRPMCSSTENDTFNSPSTKMIQEKTKTYNSKLKKRPYDKYTTKMTNNESCLWVASCLVSCVMASQTTAIRFFVQKSVRASEKEYIKPYILCVMMNFPSQRASSVESIPMSWRLMLNGPPWPPASQVTTKLLTKRSRENGWFHYFPALRTIT